MRANHYFFHVRHLPGALQPCIANECRQKVTANSTWLSDDHFCNTAGAVKGYIKMPECLTPALCMLVAWHADHSRTHLSVRRRHLLKAGQSQSRTYATQCICMMHKVSTVQYLQQHICVHDSSPLVRARSSQMHFRPQPQDDMAVSQPQPQNISHRITAPPSTRSPTRRVHRISHSARLTLEVPQKLRHPTQGPAGRSALHSPAAGPGCHALLPPQ